MPDAAARVHLDVAEALARLRAHGGRVTQARRAIIQVLAAAGGHLTAEELLAAMAEHDASVHRATIYRTLDALERVGVIEHVHLGHGSAVFHLVGSSHYHLSCERCGTVIEVPESIFSASIATITERWGFHPRLSHFAIIGVCAECAAKGHRKGLKATSSAGTDPETTP
jgi:Fur family ferric uptake transcriptional regulator